MNFAQRILHFSQNFLPPSAGGVVILGYHLVGADTSLRVDIPEAVFERQMLEIRKHGDLMSLHKAVKLLRNGSLRNKTAVVVSFDDAFENFYERAWPLLRELSIPATLFVPVGFLENEASTPLQGTASLPPVSWAQLAHMVSTGLLTIGSHGWSHLDLRTATADAAMHELERSREVLEARLETSVGCYCYPRGLWSRRAERFVRQAYEFAALAGGRKLTRNNFDPFRLWRVPITRDMPNSLVPVLKNRVWLEEWFADKWRRLVR